MNRAAIVSVGLGAFVVARNSVHKNRYAIMKMRERIRDETHLEQEEKKSKELKR